MGGCVWNFLVGFQLIERIDDVCRVIDRIHPRRSGDKEHAAVSDRFPELHGVADRFYQRNNRIQHGLENR